VLAQAAGGLTCLLLPRWRPDGSANALRIMRLKDKLGNWSNASSEVEFCNAFAHRIGDARLNGFNGMSGMPPLTASPPLSFQARATQRPILSIVSLPVLH